MAADLSGANLTSAKLCPPKCNACLRSLSENGADLTKANLSNADLSHADLSNANLSNANLSGATRFLVDLTGTNLDGAVGI
jgi:uncharacterized protein YjbI with pentapeptide repeats